MQVHRFDHCLLYGSNAMGTVKLFREVLDFDLTEQVLTPERDSSYRIDTQPYPGPAPGKHRNHRRDNPPVSRCVQAVPSP